MTKETFAPATPPKRTAPSKGAPEPSVAQPETDLACMAESELAAALAYGIASPSPQSLPRPSYGPRIPLRAPAAAAVPTKVSIGMHAPSPTAGSLMSRSKLMLSCRISAHPRPAVPAHPPSWPTSTIPLPPNP